MADYWKHKNPDVLRYGTDDVGPVEPDQALRDWNRQIKAGKKGSYFINGVSLFDIRANEQKNGDPLTFKDVDELRMFFVKHLFAKVNDQHTKELLANLAIRHFHQAGLPHATNACLKNLSTGNERIKVADPVTRIDFTPTDDGVSIKETNKYSKWAEIYQVGRAPIEHVRKKDKDYYAKTESTYLFDSNDIKLVDLTIDCPSRNLAPIFDKRPKEEQIIRSVSFLRELIAKFVSMVNNGVAEERKIDPKTIYTH